MYSWKGKSQKVIGVILLIILISAIIVLYNLLSQLQNKVFDQKSAFNYIETQMALGPRVPGSEAHKAFIQWAAAELEKNKWQVELQTGEFSGHSLTNIIGKKGSGKEIVILSAHYDSRLVADQDKEFPTVIEPVPGANDGASGVAVLIELSRVIKIPLDKQIWIVLFDIEDNGNLQDWNWTMGSQYFADHLEIIPTMVVNIDMVGDTDLNIFKERNSTSSLNDQIWSFADKLGYNAYFIPKYAYSIVDDHSPFLKKGINAIDIIDMDYAYWHTREDVISKVSADSLGVVGNVLEKWIEQ